MRKQKNKSFKIKDFGRLTKFVLRGCLFLVFVFLLSLLSILFICWCDSLYNISRGEARSPLLNMYLIVTDSMVPTINVNDAIVVKRVNNDALDVGDIITFSSVDKFFNGLTVTHRIVGKQMDVNGNYIYRTKGDNNFLEDTTFVDLDHIYGKVLFRVPKIGYVYGFVSSSVGFILSMVIPVLLVIVYEIWRIARVIKKRYSEVQI